MVAQAIKSFHNLSGNLRGVLWMTLGMAVGVFVDVNVKLVDASVPTTQIVWMRALTTLAMFLPVVFWLGKKSIRVNRPGLQLARGIFWYLSLFLIFFAVRQMSIAQVTAYLFLEVLFTVLLAAVILKEALTRRKLIAVFLGLAGAWVMCIPEMDGFGIPLGILASLAAAVFFAGMTLTSKILTKTESNFSLLFWPQIIGLAIMTPFALTEWSAASQTDWLLVTAAGICAMLANWCFLNAVRVADASVISPAAYTALPFSVLVDLAFFDLLPTTILWIGSGLIISAVALVDLRAKKAHKPVQEEC